MKKRKEKNVILILIGTFFIMCSIALIDFFLPFYLKEKGLSALEIGLVITIGIATGAFFTSLLYSKILRKIKIKTGFILSTILALLSSASLYFFQNSFGVILSQGLLRAKTVTFGITQDVSLQHNKTRNKERLISSLSLIFDNFGVIVGLILSIILINKIGFEKSFLVFAVIALPALIFFGKIHESTRFKLKKEGSKSRDKIPGKVKELMLSEAIYYFGLSLSFSIVITFLVIDRFSQSFNWIGYLMIGLYSSMTITTLLTRKFLHKKDLRKTTLIGMIILLLSAIVMISSQNIYGALTSMILEGIGAGIWVPSNNALRWKMTKPKLRETVSGYLIANTQLAKIMGILAGGFLVTYFGIISPFYVKSVLATVSIIIYLKIILEKS